MGLVEVTEPIILTLPGETDGGDQSIDAHSKPDISSRSHAIPNIESNQDKPEDATLHNGDNYSGPIDRGIVGGQNNQNTIHNGDVINVSIHLLSIEGKVQGQVPRLPVMDKIRWKELYLNIQRNIEGGWDDVDADKAGLDSHSFWLSVSP